MKKKLFVGVIGILLLLSGLITSVGAEGRGLDAETGSETVEIHDWHDLDSIRDDLAGDYVLMNDLDENTEGYDEYVGTDDGWVPIGEFDDEAVVVFSGSFDGQGHEIRDLNIDRPGEDGVGLFIGSEGQIKEVSVVDGDISGRTVVGGLLATNDGIVDDSHVSGDMSGEGAGGLIGLNRGRVANSSASSDVSGDGSGGLVGGNAGMVVDSHVSGDVRGDGVGGLAGVNFFIIQDSSAACEVEGDDDIGGLVGRNLEEGTIVESRTAGNVTGVSNVGGLVGENRFGTVEYSSASANVSGEDQNIGGLIGHNSGTVDKSSAFGEVYGIEQVGGLVGSNSDDGTISASYATGELNSEGDVGGFVGINKGLITDSYATGEVVGDGFIGGFAATNQGTVEDSYSTGYVSAGTRVGGLVARNDGAVSASYWNGETSGRDFSEGGTRLTTSTMTDYENNYPGAYENWDFENTWQVTSWNEDALGNRGYPALQWEERITEDEYDLTINIDGNGTTDPAEGTYTFEEGTEVPVTATPDDGWEFEGWTGDHEVADREITVIMDSDKQLTANFKEENDVDIYSLVVESQGEGQVDIDPDQDEFENGTEVDLTAKAAVGWYFVEWTGDHTGTEKEITVTMDSDKELIAVFEEEVKYELTIDVDGDGTTDPEEGTHTYEEGEEVTVTAVSAEGWSFENWTGDETGTDTSIEIVMDSDKRLTAHFEEEIDHHELTIIIEGEGNVEIEPDREEYEDGTEVTLEAVSEDGWNFVEWTGDFEGESENITVVMDDDKEITATFEEDTPGFTSILFISGLLIAALIYYKKS